MQQNKTPHLSEGDKFTYQLNWIHTTPDKPEDYIAIKKQAQQILIVLLLDGTPPPPPLAESFIH